MHEHSDTTFIRRQALYICACAHYCLVVRNSVIGNSIMASTGGSSGGSAHNRLRQQVMNTTSLLLQAVDNLHQQRSTPGRGSSSSSNVLDSDPNQSSSVSISGTPHQVESFPNRVGSSNLPIQHCKLLQTKLLHPQTTSHATQRNKPRWRTGTSLLLDGHPEETGRRS